MTDLNHVNFIGRIVKDTILEKTPKTEIAMARFSVAVNRDVRTKDGTYESKASFIDLAIFDKFAEKLYIWLKKGTLIAIEGHLDQQSWIKDNVTKSKLVVIVDNIQLLSSPKEQVNKDSEPENETFTRSESKENYENEYIDEINGLF